MKRQRTELRYALLLLLTAFIWGSAFVAQAIGAEALSPLSFVAIRNWIASLALVPVEWYRLKQSKKSGENDAKEAPSRKTILLGGLICGSFLFLGNAFQQAGMGLTTAAKGGFITTLYVILVPIFSIFFGMAPEKKIWFCALLALCGLYLLSISGDLSFSKGDALILCCAFSFTFQMISIGFFAKKIDPILLALLQFLVTAILSSIGALLFENPTRAEIAAAMPTILYAAILSSALAFTIQVYVQAHLSPSVAALMMSMESVFAALCGFIILKQALTGRELLGCLIMFCAIVISQVDFPKKRTLVP